MEYQTVEDLQARVDELEALLRQAERHGSTAPPEPDLGQHAFVEGETSQFLDLPLEVSSYEHDEDGTLPSELQDHLQHLSADRSRVEAFFEYLYQFNFFMDAKDFRRRLELPTSDPHSPHPSLMTAIFLAGTHFSTRDVASWQPILVRRTHRLISQSTTLGDPAVSFAVGCGFHQMAFRSAAAHEYPQRATIPSPQDEAEMIQRIRMWHSIFMLDRGSSWTSGVPPYLAEEDIVTPWPVSSGTSQRDLHALLNSSSPILQNLYGPTGFDAATVRPGDSSLSIRARSIAIFDKALFLDRSYASNADQSFGSSFNDLIAALTTFRDTLPSLYSPPCDFPIDLSGDEYQDDNGHVDTSSWCRIYTLLMAHSCVLGSLALLHGIHDNEEEHARRSYEASSQLAHLVRELKDFNPRRMPILIISGWAAAATRLLKHVQTSSSSTLPRVNEPEARCDFDTIYQALLQIRTIYPITGMLPFPLLPMEFPHGSSLLPRVARASTTALIYPRLTRSTTLGR
ncbi:uncharacterized protein EI90DRAFT_3019661 [Cantharellus anzutake]|uniref:uncharacterized protein n=1 Tax=Cantharellus anzutake TaxID=1750568 RepID=UPI0019089F07|nr:uncharacterized protein EI90DRAFT_3019661 [Cantharellus anzutake]KAF8324304.1 hypothetical protein EI90DRAFT_3019661 [Cantharellus anzutake]